MENNFELEESPSMVRCQVCRKEFDCESEFYKGLCDSIPSYDLDPSKYHVCSLECVSKGLRIQGFCTVLRGIRSNQNMPYGLFVEVFEFPEEGGYAEGKYEQFRMNAFQFFLSLDNEKIIKICDKFLKEF